MKSATALCAFLLVAMFALGASSQCPVPGTYSTYTNTISPGHASEAWCGNIGPGVPGNTENAMSWDGMALGAQWRVWGMYIDGVGAVETGRSFDAYGNGWIDYTTNYLGGQFWLSKDHLWGDGVHDLTGTLNYYNVGTRVSYIEGTPVGATSNIFFTGQFDDCPGRSLEYVITNAMLVWRSDSGLPRPDNYPGFLCDANSGELFDVCCITARIEELVATEESSWGAIKELYR
ncbi:MAG TPA: hypothetical protein ENO08_03085 [Candidatus Eisenbacteria bacterium]|uniref:Uncharacterized protein n=1 Tax=Eiseniibacteriota bacterium TaxID=2212470 RepID=A0A7V2AUG1_UNCEI|nr:hypothetical protein [Candidatus Eisenbacteria bacterium]